LRYSVLAFPQPSDVSRNYEGRVPGIFRHPFYGYVGVRPALAQHTGAEHEAIRKWAAARSSLVEIGVAEGVSAVAIREVMAEKAGCF
jgi:hypothetical protein